jgi:hypothetical protein
MPQTEAHAPAQDGPSTRPSAAQLLSATGGVPLPGPVLQRMQQAFGTGFGRVKVHRGAEAEAFDAAAFTTGERIFLPKDAPDLSSSEGQAVLSHELTHVLQQRSGRVRVNGGGISVDPHPHLEQEAKAAGDAVSRGQVPALGSHPSGEATEAPGGTAVQRLSEDDEGIELQPIGSHNDGQNADEHAKAEAPKAEEQPQGEVKPQVAEKSQAEEKPKPEQEHEAEAEAEAEATGTDAAAAKPKPKPSKLARGVKAVASLFADPGTGSGGSLQQTDMQVLQNLGSGGELAKQAEASGSAYPPAPDPMVDWAQPQPADPSAPPPFQAPDRPQPEQPASIQADPPPSPSGGRQSREFGGSDEKKPGEETEKAGTQQPAPDKPKAAA